MNTSSTWRVPTAALSVAISCWMASLSRQAMGPVQAGCGIAVELWCVAT